MTRSTGESPRPAGEHGREWLRDLLADPSDDGLVLGPTVLGVVAPAVTAVVAPVPAELAALASMGLVLLLVLAETEVDVAALRRRLRPTVALAAGASVVPFLMGFALGWLLPAWSSSPRTRASRSRCFSRRR